jgi:hypothetical protein
MELLEVIRKSILPMDEFINLKLPERPSRCRYDPKLNVILIDVHPGYEYEVDLDRCTSSAAALDWIHQVGPSSKTWGREIIADFLMVLFEVIPSTWWSGKA